MINLIWAAMILVGIITALLTGHMEDVNAGIIDAGSDAVSLCITMLGIVTMWCGIMKIAERTGLMKKWSSKMSPVMKFLFPRLSPEHPAYEYMCTNIIANIVGLGWAATPPALKAMQELAKDNKSLGIFNLDGIAPAPRGVPQIEVTFDIDANGIVSVSAKDMGTGKEQAITITSSSNMSKEDVEKAIREAEQYAEQDKAAREKVETKNQADSMVFQTEKALKDAGDNIPADIKSEIEGKISDLKKAVESDNVEDMKAKMEALSEAAGKIYAQAQHSLCAATKTSLLKIDVNSGNATLNEKAIGKIPVKLYEGQYVAPLRETLEALGYSVSWDDESKITYVEGPKETEIEENKEPEGTWNFNADDDLCG